MLASTDSSVVLAFVRASDHLHFASHLGAFGELSRFLLYSYVLQNVEGVKHVSYYTNRQDCFTTQLAYAGTLGCY